MKKAKEFNFSADKEVSREEMRAMTASVSGIGSEATTLSGSGSGSGSGGTNPPPTPDPIPGGSGSGSGSDWHWPWEDDGIDERGRQQKACEGKGFMSGCTWVGSGGITQSGTCYKEYYSKEFVCASNGGLQVDPASGTGGYSAKRAACLGLEPREKCSYLEKGLTYRGQCLETDRDMPGREHFLHCGDTN